ncbi:MAG: TraE/TraK family type IV conjugative transfer system protein [Candidatus Micrarchaeaceae archaeon]
MDNKIYLNEYRNTIKSNNILKFTLFILLLLILIEGFFIIYSMNTQRTIIVPNVNGKYIISNSSANETYIKQMSYFLVDLMEDFTPSTVKSNYSEFLNYVAPDVYGKIQADIMANAENYIATDTSSFFAPKTFKMGPNKVVIIGDKRLVVGNQVVSSQTISIIITYTINQGKYEVTSYVESKNTNY